MTRVLIAVWVCDRCKHADSDDNPDLMPAGWIHTMDGRDLCKECAA